MAVMDVDSCKKIFGGLNFALPQKTLLSFLESEGVPAPKLIFMNNSAGKFKPACAFATFETHEEASKALVVHGKVNSMISPTCIKASPPPIVCVCGMLVMVGCIYSLESFKNQLAPP